ncbi:MAG: hypothetical protein NT141_04225 [candidate division WWE3 bacterium]|nr:hypothetical protein [candidate division WWE3 bacterium]
MSKKVFFSEIIEYEEFILFFKGEKLAEIEITQVIAELEETLHAKTLEFILEELPQEHHEEFLTLFLGQPEDVSHWDRLILKKPDIKEKVTTKVHHFKKELLTDLKK